MKLYNDSERFDGIFQLKDIDDSQEYGYSEVLQKIYNDLYVNGGAFKGEKGDPGTPATNGKDGVSVSIVNNKYDNPLDDSVITTPAHSASLNIITEGSDQYFVILTNTTDTATETTWENVKASAVKISGDRGSDGFDGLSGADSVVPGPPGKDGKDAISWVTKALQFDTPDNQIVVQPYTTIIVFIKSTGSVATYTNITDAPITTNTNVFVYISLKGDKGDSIKGDVGPQGNPSDVMNRAYTSADFNEVITVTPKTILLLTAKYTDVNGPHTQFGVYVNNSDSPVDVTANLSNTLFNWNDLQGSKGLDSTVPGPKGDPGESIKGDKGDPGQITDTVVLNLTNPNNSDTININAYTLAFVFSITNSDKMLAIYNNNTSQTQTPSVGSLTFTSLLGKQGIPGIQGAPGKDSTVPGPASKIVTAFLNNPTADSTVTTPGNTTTIVYVTTTNSSGMVLSKMGSVTNNSSNYITTEYSDINLTQVSSDQVIPEPGKNANVKTVTFNDLDTSTAFSADARTAYIITNKVTSTGIVYIGTISNDTDSPAELSYSNVSFNKISGDSGKDGKDGVSGGVIKLLEGDSTATQVVPANTKIQVFDSVANVIAVYINDTDQEVTKAANFTFKPKGGGDNPSSGTSWVFDKPYYDSFWYQNFIESDFEINAPIQNPIKNDQYIAPVFMIDIGAVSGFKQYVSEHPEIFDRTPYINKITKLSSDSLIYSLNYNYNSSFEYTATLTSSLIFNQFDNKGINNNYIQSPINLDSYQDDGRSRTFYNLKHNQGEEFVLNPTIPIPNPYGWVSDYTLYATPIIHLADDEDKVLMSNDFKNIYSKYNLETNLSAQSKGDNLKWLNGDSSASVGSDWDVIITDSYPVSFDATHIYTNENNEVAVIVIQKISDNEYWINGHQAWSHSQNITINSETDRLVARWHVTSDKPIIWDSGSYEPGTEENSTRLYINSMAVSNTNYGDQSSYSTMTIVKQTTAEPKAFTIKTEGRQYSDLRFINSLTGWPTYSEDDDPLETNAKVNIEGSLAKLNKMYYDNWFNNSDFLNEVSNGSFIKAINLGTTGIQGTLSNPYLIPWKFNISDQRTQS